MIKMQKWTKMSLVASFGVSMAAQAEDPQLPQVKDLSKFPSEMLAIQKDFSQSGSLASLVPEKMKAGQNGYLIATSEEFKNSSKMLQDFIAHKESRGFKVYLATEKDWGVAKKGGGKGRHQADQVRKWMQENYKKMNLLYTLIIASPHPDEGVIPMAKFKPRRYKVATPDQKKDYPKYLKYKDNPRTPDGKYLLYDGSQPSDYYYADLDSEWDANGNSILAEKEDYETGKINCVADVYVGRIPLYGGDHPWSQISDVDEILQRTIDYENDKRDLRWRNNLFYVGGADKRFKILQDHFLNYTGGELVSYRVSSGYGYEPTSSKWNNEVITKALNQNQPFGFTNFQEHGSWNSMAGQINNKSAATLKTDFPSYVYLGGCDVASPEHGENVTHALFRHIGVAAMGATRSVTGLGGDDDTNSAAEYERLYFGQSTGEAHWRLLSDYADGMKKVGASNFLMNLMGDPSVVIFPKADVAPLILSPNMEVLKFNHQHRSKSPIGYTFTVRNTTGEKCSYTVGCPDDLLIAETSFDLPPNGMKKLLVLFKDADQLDVGEHKTQFTVNTGNVTHSRNLALNVYGRTTVLHLPFDTLAGRKIAKIDGKGEKAEMVKKFTAARAKDDFFTLPKGSRADLSRTKVVPGEADVTVAVKIKFDKTPKGKLQFLNFGKTYQCMDLSIEDGKLYCVLRTVKGNAKELAEGRIEVPVPATGKWHSVVAFVNRADKKMTLLLDGKKYETPFAPMPGQGIVFDKMRLGYGKNKQEISFKDLTVFDYALGEKELAALSDGKIIKQTFPKNSDKAHPAGVNLSWNYTAAKKGTTFVVALAGKPDFSDKKLLETKSSSLLVSDLEDNKTYYWKVGFKENGKVEVPWDSFATFTTDSTLENPEIKLTNKQLRAAKVKDNGYTEKLSKIASAQGKPKANGKPTKVELFYAKVDGPEWLRCHSDGSLTTNFGAPAAGQHEFTFSVSTRYGQPVQFKRTITVK